MKSMFGRYGPWALAGLAGATTTFVVKCASRVEDSGDCSKPSNRVHVIPPDFAPMTRWDSNWDKLDPQFIKRKVWSDASKEDKSLKYPTARRNIFLVRHGQYNQKGGCDDQHTLTKLGEEQAALAGKRLANSGIKFTSIVSSGMTRAIQTSEIMLQEMKETYPNLKLDIKDQIINEGPPCIPEPAYRNQDLWDPDFNEFYAEGARIEAGFRKYFHRAALDQKEDSFEIIVCHANVIRYFTVRALQFPPEGWLRIGLDHTSLTKISILPEGDVVLRGLGDSGHLPPGKISA